MMTIMDVKLSFSALQRAENSSILAGPLKRLVLHEFQCSSASRKFLNPRRAIACNLRLCSFSALQRAENSSIDGQRVLILDLPTFQCSSASRKFLNIIRHYPYNRNRQCFSALQRAENSSILTRTPSPRYD